ncbi:2-amino-4-hydroxy-6-hydroxymethyldihydropteridine diphosphokinase [uncultured Desulfovibrio sp.]|uniref:2-amino-4-hydroxy-6- hydroxymethyldihydropteridine diphosphokinase n=1 Tax=uncultured Desulfovibrio sp. TaxID=167968 RepID=UPI00260E6A35|nr:2-amino-4-hydroxy-6-hydroxymethyldihydropteridine diphosphokinase [uncultured Desulfovibrio sp.]
MTCACSSALLAYIGLGSNTPDAPQRLTTASEALDRLEGLHVLRASSRYSTEPQGYAGQPWFENAVLEVAVDSRRWQPRELLAALLGMEVALGRRRNPALRFGPRSIDMDLLLFGQVQSDDPWCLLPHPRMCERAFVLVPLAELAPGLLVKGRSVTQWLAGLSWRREGRAIFQ